jgi:predicted nucleic acid-binding protein
MGSNFTAIYDACVLYPAPLRDLLMQLALSDLYRARWTEQIHDEWMRNVLKNRADLSKEQLMRTKNLMNRSVRNSLIENYESMIPSLNLPDPDDRHVLAAAIKGQADIIVTINLKDFPDRILSKYEIEAQHPDIFIADLIDLYPIRVTTAAENCRKRLKNPPKSIDEYLEILLKQGLTMTVSLLKQYYYEV